jgi:hypothetical protein
VAGGGGAGDAQAAGGLLDGQPGVIMQLDQLRFLPVFRGEQAQGFVQRQEVRGVSR